VTRAWAAAALLVLLGCAPVGLAVAEDHPMSDDADTDAVVDAVYHALLAVAAPDASEVVCLVERRTVDGEEELGDPTAEHLARLQKENPKVRPGSACKRGRTQPAVEAATGAKAVVLDIGPVEWTGKDTARTAAGFGRGGYTSTEYLYELTRSVGGWTITKTSRGSVI
jgi:hypothetical protein